MSIYVFRIVWVCAANGFVRWATHGIWVATLVPFLPINAHPTRVHKPSWLIEFWGHTPQLYSSRSFTKFQVFSVHQIYPTKKSVHESQENHYKRQ